MNGLIALMGGSGAGKNTIINEILKDSYFCSKMNFIRSIKTREYRENETPGISYIKKTICELEHMKQTGELLEYNEYKDPHTHQVVGKYGTSIDEVKKVLATTHGIKELDPKGFTQLLQRESLLDFPIKGIYVQVSNIETLQERIMERDPHINKKELSSRLTIAQQEQEIIKGIQTHHQHYGHYQYELLTIIDNSQDIDIAVKTTKKTLLDFFKTII